MITTLHIKNIGIIDDLNIEFGDGFNVLTGETGAGKTLIIDAINIICGGRFSKDMIRKGEKYSYVEMNIYMPESKYSIDNNIIITREIQINGKNSCKINGRLVTVNELKEFMKMFIDIHKQNDNLQILDPEYQIECIDNFNKNETENLLLEYQNEYRKYLRFNNELKSNYGDEREKERRLDLLQYEFDEIDTANLKSGEEEELKEKSIMFENSEKIAKNVYETYNQCSNAAECLNNAVKSMENIGHISKTYEDKINYIKSIYYEVEELSRDLNDQNNSMDFDEEERDNIEERLDLIYSLKRKYGNSIDEILDFKEKTRNEIEKINNLDEENNKLRAKIKETEANMNKLALKLHVLREKISKEISEEINNELSELEMPNAKFSVMIEKSKSYNKFGTDIIKFEISTNIGEDYKDLTKIASGGEMSRIMLAIKTVLTKADKIPTIIFDEIDTGISGNAAKSVGKKLKLIGKFHQVICITHQPSIAAKGDVNFFIGKRVDGTRTCTYTKKLNEDDVINEVARISNGDVTEASRKHALELIKSA